MKETCFQVKYSISSTYLLKHLKVLGTYDEYALKDF